MLGHQLRARDRARADEGVERGAAPPATHRAGACRIERALILAEARVADVDRAAARECLPGAARSGGEHAIEHVDPALDAADDVVGLADPHQIAWFVVGQLLRRIIEAAEHRLLPLADREPAPRIDAEADVEQSVGGGPASYLIK